jgi:hypothetical protein
MPWWAWMLLGMAFAVRWQRRAWRRHPFWMHGGRVGPGGWGMVMMGGRGCAAHRRARGREVALDVMETAPVELTPQQKREQAMAALRRRYVADEITVEEYERELDRLIREK